MNTFASPQKLANAASDNLNAFQSLADIMLSASGQLLALNFDAARNLCASASAVTPVIEGELREQVASRMGVQAKSLEQTVQYLTGVNGLVIRTQGELADFGVRQINGASNAIGDTLDQIAGSAPAGTSELFAAIKSAMTNAATSYENFIKNSRNMAESNLNAAGKALQPMLTASAEVAKSSKKAA